MPNDTGYFAPGARTGSANRLAWLRANPLDATLVVFGLSFCVLRYVGLEKSPPGFFSDEFRGALHQICLGQLGTSAYGVRWPLFVEGMGGGLYTPIYLYLGMVWTWLFGPSIAVSRAFVATFSILTVAATTLIARRVAGPRAAAVTFAAGALMPWSFHFARIAWDPPLAPAFLMWAIFFWLKRARWGFLIASALCFAGALYCYPPTRIQAPLVFLLLGGWGLYRRSLKWSHVLAFAALVGLVALPLIQGTLDGSLSKRGAHEAIWASHFVEGNRGRYSPGMFVVYVLFDHLQAHFRPTFLFFTGDFNLRSSTQFFGVFGFLDTFALGVAFAAGLRALVRRAREQYQALELRFLTAARGRLLGFAAAGYLFGILPAALCWSGVPHALRSIGAWPFLALATGVVLAMSLDVLGRWFRGLLLAVAALHAGVYLTIYFAKYPSVPGEWFDVSVKAAMLEPGFDASRRLGLVRFYPEGFRYYSIAYGHETCASSSEKLASWLADPSKPPLTPR